MNVQRLNDTAAAFLAGDKGLLAINESISTCNKRIAEFGIRQPAETRRAQQALIHHANCNRAARRGGYIAAMESSFVADVRRAASDVART